MLLGDTDNRTYMTNRLAFILMKCKGKKQDFNKIFPFE